MIGRTFRAEWVKFLRLGQLLGSWGPMVGFGILLAILLLANASDLSAAELAEQAQQGGGGQAPTIPRELIEASDGGVFAFQSTGTLLGIIALVITAANLATEYTSGTLKVMLVREPRRIVFLGGKLAALWSFIWIGITLTLLLCFLAAILVAAGRGFDMSAWWSADGWSAFVQAYLNVGAGALVWSLFGAMLAILFRSGFPAIGLGIAYPLVVEGILGLVLPDVVKWMPGSVLARLAEGDTTQAIAEGSGGSEFGVIADPLSYGAAVAVTLAYAVVFAAVAAILLQRRDVS